MTTSEEDASIPTTIGSPKKNQFRGTEDERDFCGDNFSTSADPSGVDCVAITTASTMVSHRLSIAADSDQYFA